MDASFMWTWRKHTGKTEGIVFVAKNSLTGDFRVGACPRFPSRYVLRTQSMCPCCAHVTCSSGYIHAMAMHTKYSKLNYRSLAKEHPISKGYPPLRFGPMFCIGSLFTLWCTLWTTPCSWWHHAHGDIMLMVTLCHSKCWVPSDLTSKPHYCYQIICFRCQVAVNMTWMPRGSAHGRSFARLR